MSLILIGEYSLPRMYFTVTSTWTPWYTCTSCHDDHNNNVHSLAKRLVAQSTSTGNSKATYSHHSFPIPYGAHYHFSVRTNINIGRYLVKGLSKCSPLKISSHQFSGYCICSSNLKFGLVFFRRSGWDIYYLVIVLTVIP